MIAIEWSESMDLRVPSKVCTAHVAAPSWKYVFLQKASHHCCISTTYITIACQALALAGAVALPAGIASVESLRGIEAHSCRLLASSPKALSELFEISFLGIPATVKL